MLRKGLKNIEVNETVEFQLSYYNINNFGKKQYSGFINDNENEFWYLPTHQQLVDKLNTIPRGSLVRATRLTKGGVTKDKKEAAKYDVKVLRKGFPKGEQSTLDSF